MLSDNLTLRFQIRKVGDEEDTFYPILSRKKIGQETVITATDEGYYTAGILLDAKWGNHNEMIVKTQNTDIEHMSCMHIFASENDIIQDAQLQHVVTITCELSSIH